MKLPYFFYSIAFYLLVPLNGLGERIDSNLLIFRHQLDISDSIYNSDFNLLDFEDPVALLNARSKLDSMGLAADKLILTVLKRKKIICEPVSSTAFLTCIARQIKIGEEFLVASKIYASNNTLFHAVAYYWLTKAGDSLIVALNKDPALMDQFDYKYQIKRLEEDKFAIELPARPYSQKVFFNLKENRLGYLFTQFYGRISWPYRFILFFIVGLFIWQQLFFLKLLYSKLIK